MKAIKIQKGKSISIIKPNNTKESIPEKIKKNIVLEKGKPKINQVYKMNEIIENY